LLAGRVDDDVILRVLERGRVYDDVVAQAMDAARMLDHADVVERILIHLESQTPPGDFRIYGPRVVPFYNYLQAAFVLNEDGRLGADGVLRVAVELVTEHRFDGDALARSYLDLARRGHLRGTGIASVQTALEAWLAQGHVPAVEELRVMAARLPAMIAGARAGWTDREQPVPDYVALVDSHNPRRRR
jgi:hypothetical protein